jgi:hypothetical protein
MASSLHPALALPQLVPIGDPVPALAPRRLALPAGGHRRSDPVSFGAAIVGVVLLFPPFAG